MVPFGRTAIALVVLNLTLALTGCADIEASPPAQDIAASAGPSPSPGASETATDLSAIACATDDPEDVGELTGAWSGNEGGVYYIRHVGDCVWWFGTELDDFEPGLTGQPGFANVASGRVNGTRIDVEWADLPVGNILGGGGLTLVYDKDDSRLVVTEQRGDWTPFGATMFTRLESSAPPGASPSASASP